MIVYSKKMFIRLGYNKVYSLFFKYHKPENITEFFIKINKDIVPLGHCFNGCLNCEDELYLNEKFIETVIGRRISLCFPDWVDDCIRNKYRD